MRYLRSFVLFWWDFVVGDDWVLAVGVVAGLALTALLGAWWVLPPFVAVTLGWSLRRAAR
jgi:hypothetical protein